MHDLRGQFVISRGQQEMRPDWRTFNHSGWILQAHTSLPVHNLLDAAGARVGWLLGYAIDTIAQRMITGDWHLACGASLNNFASIENQIFSLAGRYVLVLLGSDIERIYVDPSASLSMLYSTEASFAGSTAEALGIAEPLPSLAVEVRRTRGISGTWYPCGTTQWPSLRVLAANHYLDLETWSVKRHWPQSDQSEPSKRRSTASIVNEICDRLSANVAAVVAEYPTTMELTAGRDTRMLLACSKIVASKIQFQTSPTHSTVDVDVSEKIAKLFDLHHHVSQPVNLKNVVLQGAAGEVGRAFYWRNTDNYRTTLTAQELAARMNFPAATFVPRLQIWLDQLTHMNIFVKLDLLYIEHRLAMAHSPANYEHDRSCKFSLLPLSDRRIFELMMSLPPPYRFRQQLCTEICRLRWPELNLFPINLPFFEHTTKYRKLFEQWRCKTLDSEQLAYLRHQTFRDRSLAKMIFEDAKKVWLRLLRAARLRSPAS